MELQSRWETLLALQPDSNINASPWKIKAFANASTVLDGTINAFACPSDSTAYVGDTSVRDTPTCYVMNRGDSVTGTRNNTNTPSPDFIGRALFVHYYWNSIATVTDGTSNTVAFGEQVVGVRFEKKIKGNLAYQAVDALDPVSSCGLNSGVVSTTEPGFYAVQVNSLSRGFRIADGRGFYISYNAVLPPNSPSCVNSADDISDNGAFSLSSFHSGGVNVALVDGSVRFISDSISAVTPGVTFPLAEERKLGPSDYGPWGSLATPQGGETITL